MPAVQIANEFAIIFAETFTYIPEQTVQSCRMWCKSRLLLPTSNYSWSSIRWKNCKLTNQVAAYYHSFQTSASNLLLVEVLRGFENGRSSRGPFSAIGLTSSETFKEAEKFSRHRRWLDLWLSEQSELRKLEEIPKHELDVRSLPIKFRDKKSQHFWWYEWLSHDVRKFLGQPSWNREVLRMFSRAIVSKMRQHVVLWQIQMWCLTTTLSGKFRRFKATGHNQQAISFHKFLKKFFLDRFQMFDVGKFAMQWEVDVISVPVSASHEYLTSFSSNQSYSNFSKPVFQWTGTFRRSRSLSCS